MFHSHLEGAGALGLPLNMSTEGHGLQAALKAQTAVKALTELIVFTWGEETQRDGAKPPRCRSGQHYWVLFSYESDGELSAKQ